LPKIQQACPDLAIIASGWSELPDALKNAILVIIKANAR